MTSEVSIHMENDKPFEGKMKGKFEHNIGTLDYNYATSDGSYDAEFRFPKLLKNGIAVARFENNLGKLGLEYKMPNLALTAHGSSNFDNSGMRVEASAVGNYSGFSLGGSGSYSVKDAAVDDYNVGVEYNASKTTVSAFTQNKLEDLTFGLHQEIANRNPSLKNSLFGFRLETQTASFENATLSVGGIHQCSQNLTCRGKIDTKGALAMVYERRLDNPNLVFSLAAQWNLLKRNTVPERLGFGIKVDA